MNCAASDPSRQQCNRSCGETQILCKECSAALEQPSIKAKHRTPWSYSSFEPAEPVTEHARVTGPENEGLFRHVT